MAPYTLYYHSGCKGFTGRSYGLMLMLEHGQVQYECLTPDKLPQGAPCFAPPMLKFPDGRIMSQTQAIAMELGKQLGLAPSGSVETSLAMQAALDASDLFGDCMKNKANMDEFGNGRLQKWLLHVEGLLKKAGLGFLAGAELSYADFSMYLSFCLVRMFPAAKLPEKYPVTDAWMAKMDSLPCVARIKATGVPLMPALPPKQDASALSTFLVETAKVDKCVAEFLERQLKITGVGAFASHWGPDNYQHGVRDDVVAKLAPFSENVSDAAARLQVARLRTAWRLAQVRAT
mmetsp:Transcript_74326/g.168365  ORF Transcript_74326/g.168365 Transcript_74326/m.168365 type:complete len:289 (-) Transcript_74326:89-955(-)|eukprot:CAMPEP_0197910492 /NCGR_PEP_ID=MMETSP1439-20131203/71022_1 /TAXON_ID=66791 /ORGANISM="Gonyaulax spinifera, Strain CCMP409" /LENGTH=288 /DNA_ID=CAMNT_0043532153 /DNA_START=89 /DNA_END=955 /DNA_ORIENTATION=+